MKAFQTPPQPQVFVLDDREVRESILPHPKGFGLQPLRSMDPWASMPGDKRAEKRAAYFALKKKDRPQ